jgi:hypothetical protein
VEGEDDYVLLEVVDAGMGLPPKAAVTVGGFPGVGVGEVVDDDHHAVPRGLR